MFDLNTGKEKSVMGVQKLARIYVLILIGAIIGVLITGCLPRPMVKPTMNKVTVL
jgi:hypothetical protein